MTRHNFSKTTDDNHDSDTDEGNVWERRRRRRRRQRERQRQRALAARRPLQAAAAVLVVYLSTRKGVIAMVGGGISCNHCCRFDAGKKRAAFIDGGITTTGTESALCHLANLRRRKQQWFLRRKCYPTTAGFDVSCAQRRLWYRSRRLFWRSRSQVSQQCSWELAMTGKEEEGGEGGDEEKGCNEKDDGDDAEEDHDVLGESAEKRIVNLEKLVAAQAVEIVKLQQETKELRTIAKAFEVVLDLLRRAKGGEAAKDTLSESSTSTLRTVAESTNTTGTATASTPRNTNKQDADGAPATDVAENDTPPPLVEHVDDAEIFGSAPSSVMDAADAAGAALLAALLGGKRRLLVDVRDAELSQDSETLVQFIELAILPVAAGLQGLQTMRNRVKLVFPTVSQLWAYRRSMVLSSPDVVALSILAFDPVESRDSLVVIVAPHPSDEEGLEQMNQVLRVQDLPQQVVVLNYHMAPVTGPAATFEVCYQLRLLNVQYMPIAQQADSGHDDDKVKDDQGQAALTSTETTSAKPESEEELSFPGLGDANDGDDEKDENEAATQSTAPPPSTSKTNDIEEAAEAGDDAELEAAMVRARQIGAASMGQTRAMVIRAYPRPWHVFVDTSPDTDADFVVAATFDQLPTPEEVNFAIVECLEGSEREDELVAQQMQQALEAGQLNHITEILAQIGPSADDEEEGGGGRKADDALLGSEAGGKGYDYYVISGMSEDDAEKGEEKNADDNSDDHDKKKTTDTDGDDDSSKDDFNYYDDFDDLWKDEDSV